MIVIIIDYLNVYIRDTLIPKTIYDNITILVCINYIIYSYVKTIRIILKRQ